MELLKSYPLCPLPLYRLFSKTKFIHVTLESFHRRTKGLREVGIIVSPLASCRTKLYPKYFRSWIL